MRIVQSEIRRFFRFVIVGLFNTGFSFGVYALLVHASLPFTVAALIANVAGILFNFKTTGRFVFRSNKNSLFVRFVIVYGLVYILGIAGIRILLQWGLDRYLAGAVTAPPMALVSYTLLSLFVYRKPETGGQDEGSGIPAPYEDGGTTERSAGRPQGGISIARFYPVLVMLFVGAGLWLSVDRVFQVDEIQNLHMSWLLAQPDAANFYNSASLYTLPLAVLSGWCPGPVSFLLISRIVFFGLFLTSLAVMARGLAPHRRSRFRGLMLLMAVAPVFWEHGFEVRHDNIIILGLSFLVLLLYRESRQRATWDPFWGGMTGGCLLLCSLKSALLFGPILLYLIAVCARRSRQSVLRPTSMAAGGFVISVAAGIIAHALYGSLRIYVSGLNDFAKTLGGGHIRFFDWPQFWRFLAIHPLIALLSVSALIIAAVPTGRRWARGEIFGDDDIQSKDALLFIIGAAFLAANPTFFPYNYLYIALLALPAAYHLLLRMMSLPGTIARVLAYVLIMVQGLSWAAQLPRYFLARNEDQKKIIEFVNAYTNDDQCVFDGAGLAIFRRGPARDWYLHSLSRPRYIKGEIPPVREALSTSGCPLLVSSYKWNYMQPEDLDFIRSRYVPFHRTVWILGCKIPAPLAGICRFTVTREGFYLISSRELKPVPDVRVDGELVGMGIIYLRRGDHRLDGGPQQTALYCLWVKDGHSLPPPVPDVDSPIFLDWY